MIEIEVEGLRELDRALRAASDAVGPRHARSAARGALRAVEQRASADAPRDEGRLADSIVTRSVRSDRPDTITLAVGPARDAYYGLMQELGTAHITARPFLRPAFDGTHQGVLRDFGGRLWRAIRRAARRAGGTR